MPDRPDFQFESEASPPQLTLSGDWTVHTIRDVSERLAAVQKSDVKELQADCTDLGRLDTAGAFIIDRFACRAGAGEVKAVNASPQVSALLEQAASLRPEVGSPPTSVVFGRQGWGESR